MSWFDKFFPSKERTATASKSQVPDGLWVKCANCAQILYQPELERNLFVCPKCEHHMRMGARLRLESFLDEEGREELFSELKPVDHFKFKDTKKYSERLSKAQKATGEDDALIAMHGTVGGISCVAVAFEFNFIGGSMGSVVGEKFTQAVHYALERACPLICFGASGGARMQESLVSLMQMSKTSAALKRLSEASLPYVSVMLDPCMGGVSASLATLGDFNIAEPRALIGFAGPRVIEQTVRETLPEGFQRSEFLLEHGMLDMIVDRRQMKATITRLLKKVMHHSLCDE